MVPFVSSSTKPIVTQDPLDSGSQLLQNQNNELETSRVMSDNQDGLLGHVTVLDKSSSANGAATYIPLQDPGGGDPQKEGKFVSYLSHVIRPDKTKVSLSGYRSYSQQKK